MRRTGQDVHSLHFHLRRKEFYLESAWAWFEDFLYEAYRPVSAPSAVYMGLNCGVYECRPGIDLSQEPPAVRMNDELGGILTYKLKVTPLKQGCLCLSCLWVSVFHGQWQWSSQLPLSFPRDATSLSLMSWLLKLSVCALHMLWVSLLCLKWLICTSMPSLHEYSVNCKPLTCPQTPPRAHLQLKTEPCCVMVPLMFTYIKSKASFASCGSGWRWGTTEWGTFYSGEAVCTDRGAGWRWPGLQPGRHHQGHTCCKFTVHRTVVVGAVWIIAQLLKKQTGLQVSTRYLCCSLASHHLQSNCNSRLG